MQFTEGWSHPILDSSELVGDFETVPADHITIIAVTPTFRKYSAQELELLEQMGDFRAPGQQVVEDGQSSNSRALIHITHTHYAAYCVHSGFMQSVELSMRMRGGQ